MAFKTIMVNESAYQVLASQKKGRESFSDVILRIAPPKTLKTCGELLDHLSKEEGPILQPDFLKELRERKLNPKRSARR
jgi:predicted CopG family antitoxin